MARLALIPDEKHPKEEMNMSEFNGNGIGTLDGKVALVTGASRGIGRAIALLLAKRHADVAINYRSSQADAESAAQEICKMGRKVILVKGNIGDPAEAREIVKRVLDEFGRIDILVNNAAITRDKTVRKLTDDDWQQVIQVNLNGTFYITSAAVPSMIEHQFGRIINIASYSGEEGTFGQANYAASKGGVLAFTKVLALELAKFNITANAIAPGYTFTDMMAAMPQNVQDQVKSKILLGRFGTPDDVAKAAAFLACDADFLTGQTINVNGGMYFGQ